MALRDYERHAWLLLFISGLPLLFVGVVHLVSDRPLAAGLGFVEGNLGVTWEELVAGSPATAIAILGFMKVMAVFAMGFSLLFLSVVATSFRRGERWAWYAAWLYPAGLLGFASIATIYQGWGSAEWFLVVVTPSITILMALTLLGLLLPLRRFFPKGDRREAGFG